ncbi:MAG: radical SAM protein [Planctomycetes bacterium]|nr:radical SAM protein [Planctomycetota bacterium]
MPSVCFVPLCGLRVGHESVLELGMSLPGLWRRGEAVAQLPALGTLTLAGATPEPWQCLYEPSDRVDSRLKEKLASAQPDLVAVSALTASIEEAYELCDWLRSQGICVVLGGLHVTACPDEAAQHADVIVLGEGEAVWLDLLDDAMKGSLQPQYRSAGRPFRWVIPRYEFLPPRLRRVTLQTERGCPLACEFCGASRGLGPFREKPVELIRRELAAICERNPYPRLELADDNTFARTSNVHALLDALQQSGAVWFTETDWRLGERPDLLERLAEAGCVEVLIGFESLVFRYPGQGPKAAEPSRVLRAVDAIQEAGVAVNGCFVVGADGETRQSIDRLARFLADSPLAEIQLTLQTPFPGTPLYRRLRREKRLLPDRGWPFYTMFDVVYQPDRMTPQELQQGFEELIRCVFSTEEVMKRDRIRRQVWQRNPSMRRSRP